MHSNQKSLGAPLIFGEILYDVFPEGQRILGGAPFNVAWHLQGLGLVPQLLTRVGEDGEEILQTMQQWGLLTSTVQRDKCYPTGTVQVAIHQGNPHFEIPPNQAYDYLEPYGEKLSGSLLYHGTLALRNLRSRQTFQTLLSTLHLPIFFDLNLRSPWWQPELVETYLKTATWVKLNEAEMALMDPSFQTILTQGTSQQLNIVLESFCRRYNLAMVVVTLGDQGALLKVSREPLLQMPTPKVPIVDSVGAGDAFSAVVIYGLMQHWPALMILERAVTFATAICQMRGATRPDKTLYQTTLSQWHHELPI